MASTQYVWYWWFAPVAVSRILLGSGISNKNAWSPAGISNDLSVFEEARGCSRSNVICSRLSDPKIPSKGLWRSKKIVNTKYVERVSHCECSPQPHFNILDRYDSCKGEIEFSSNRHWMPLFWNKNACLIKTMEYALDHVGKANRNNHTSIRSWWCVRGTSSKTKEY